MKCPRCGQWRDRQRDQIAVFIVCVLLMVVIGVLTHWARTRSPGEALLSLAVGMVLGAAIRRTYVLWWRWHHPARCGGSGGRRAPVRPALR